MSWVKINCVIFEYESIVTKLSLGSHSLITIQFDRRYEDILNRLYDSKIDDIIIETVKYQGHGCKVKTIESDFTKSISVTIHCEYLDLSDIQERRDINIENLLK